MSKNPGILIRPLTARQDSPPQDDKPYKLLEATPKDKQKVVSFYQHHPVPGYDVASMQVIYNRDFNQAFELQNLGMCYAKGWGVNKDLTLAVKYYQLAANQGFVLAQNSLGLCYRTGEGVTRDLTLAVKFFQLAADQEYSRAQVSLADCYEYGVGVQKNLNLAIKYYRLAADQGHKNAPDFLKNALEKDNCTIQ